MKKLFIFFILLFSLNCQAEPYKNYSDITPLFDSTGDWSLAPNLGYYYETDGIRIKSGSEDSRILLLTYSPKELNKWYGCNSCYLSDISVMITNNECKVEAEINFYAHDDMSKKVIANIVAPFVRWAGKGNPTYLKVYDTLHAKYPEIDINNLLCIDTIKLYGYDYAREHLDVTLSNLTINETCYMNYPSPDFTECEVHIGEYWKNLEDEFDLRFWLYFGHESQLVDIYLVFYNYENLYFFPSWDLEPIGINVYLEQFTFFPQWQLLSRYKVSQFEIKDKGLFAIGIAKSGTFDFLNTVYLNRKLEIIK